jgi:hypothetical protein
MPLLPWRWAQHSLVVAVLLHAALVHVGWCDPIPEEVYMTILGGLAALAVIWEDWTDWTIGRGLWRTSHPSLGYDHSEEDAGTY